MDRRVSISKPKAGTGDLGEPLDEWEAVATVWAARWNIKGNERFLSDRIVVMAARPGRVIRELSVHEPYPRHEDFRTSPEYAAHCREVSDALHEAMGEADVVH